MTRRKASNSGQRAWKKFIKESRRKKKKRERKSAFYRHVYNIIATAKANGKEFTVPPYKQFGREFHYQAKVRPELSDDIKFLAEKTEAFDRSAMRMPPNGVFRVPEVFSLTQNPNESFLFLKRLFVAFYKDLCKTIVLDYKYCETLDIDAQMCLDIMLSEFLDYYHTCQKRKIKTRFRKFEPQNFSKTAVVKILFSIASFANIGRTLVAVPGIVPFHLIQGDNFDSRAGAEREKEVTRMVDYIVERCAEMNHTLSWQDLNRLSKVLGEILGNAGEHSQRRYRYAVGYFEKKRVGEVEHGIFNFAILSFGRTIYETFKLREQEGWHVISLMKELSHKYTRRMLFFPGKFEEETLWTLYALQEGVTSVQGKKRGNGSINFIESFFSLKGDMANDHLSSLTIMSGNTRIVFDGEYQIVEKSRGPGEEPFKMMTFNESESIEDKPDEKYVTFADNFFPGTLITAKICINFNRIENNNSHG